LDPYPLPSSTTTLEGGQVGGMAYPMSAAEMAYQFIVNSKFQSYSSFTGGFEWGCGSHFDS